MTLVVGDFRTYACPADAVLCLVDPPYDIGKRYVGEKETRPYVAWVHDLLAWSTAQRTVIFGPAPTIYDWLPLVPRPDRLLWWHRTFVVPKAFGWSWFCPSMTPLLVYERDGAPWYGPRRNDRNFHDVIDSHSAVADAPRIKKAWGRKPEIKHPGMTGTQIAGKIIGPTTKEGDLVVDPMAGCGSILVAALRLHRRFWGCEISPEYAEVARAWLLDEVERL